jgi:hypothetical protein
MGLWGSRVNGFGSPLGEAQGLVPMRKGGQAKVSENATRARLSSLLKVPDNPDLRHYCYPHPHERPVFR